MSRSSSLWFLLLLLCWCWLSLSLCVCGYPGSAPSSTCNTQKPASRHGSVWASHPSPYTWSLVHNGQSDSMDSTTTLTYRVGHNVTLRIDVTDPASSAALIGIMGAAYAIDPVTGSVSLRRVGSFVADGCGLMCSGQTLIQSHNGPRKSLVITWIPPADQPGAGDVQFNFTTMQTITTWWRETPFRLQERMPPQPTNAQFISVIDAIVVQDATSNVSSATPVGWSRLTVRVQTARPASALLLERVVLQISLTNASGPFVHAVNASVLDGTLSSFDLILESLPPQHAIWIRARSFNRIGGLSTEEGAPLVMFRTSSLEEPLPAMPRLPSAQSSQQQQAPLTLMVGGQVLLSFAPFISSTVPLLGFDVQVRVSDITGAATLNSQAHASLHRRLSVVDAALVAPLIVSAADAGGWRSFFVSSSLASAGPLALPLSVPLGSELRLRLRSKNARGSSQFSAEMRLAVSSLCVNACSARGRCTSSMVCDCEQGFLGADCSLRSRIGHSGGSSGPVCFGSGRSFCLDYSLLPTLDVATIRLTIRSHGYAGLLLDAPDGMSGGFGYMMTHVPDIDVGSDEDSTSLRTVYSPGLYDPVDSTMDSSVARSVHSWSNSTHSEFIFQKAVGLAPKLLVDPEGGSLQHLAWAFGQEEADDHGANAGKVRIDWFAGRIHMLARPAYEQMYAPMMIALLAVVLGGALLGHSECVRFSRIGHALAQQRVGTWKANGATGWHRFTFDLLPTIEDALWGEAGVALALVAGCVAFLAAGYTILSQAGVHGGLAWAHVSTVMYALVLLPVTKSSVCAWVFHSSFERVLKWHRMIGRAAVVFTYVHLIDMLVVRGAGVATTGKAKDMYGLVALIALSALVLTAWEPIRRRWWRVFIAAHLSLMPVGYVFAILHSKYVWWLCTPSLCLWGIDLAVRAVRPFFVFRSTTVSAKLIVEDDGAPSVFSPLATPSPGSRYISVLELDIAGFPHATEPGSYCFINIPHISQLEFHPISISNYPRPHKDGQLTKQAGSSSTSSRVTFHVLDAGSHFSHKLRLAIQAMQSNGGASSQQQQQQMQAQLRVRVDGPYGRAQIQLHRYRVLVLCGGGIGITPLLSILDYLLVQLEQSNPDFEGLEQVHLMWSSRLQSSFEWSRELLQRSECLQGRGKLVVQLHLFVWAGRDPVPRVQLKQLPHLHQHTQMDAKHPHVIKHHQSNAAAQRKDDESQAETIELQVVVSPPAPSGAINVHAGGASALIDPLASPSGVADPSAAAAAAAAAAVGSSVFIAPMGASSSTIVGAHEYARRQWGSQKAEPIDLLGPVYRAPMLRRHIDKSMAPEYLPVPAAAVDQLVHDQAGGSNVAVARPRAESVSAAAVRFHVEDESPTSRTRRLQQAVAVEAHAHDHNAATSSGDVSAPRSDTVDMLDVSSDVCPPAAAHSSISSSVVCLPSWSPPIVFGVADYTSFFRQLAADAATINVHTLPATHAAFKSMQASHSVGVMACGPPGMVADVQRQAQKHGFEFHKESFLF